MENLICGEVWAGTEDGVITADRCREILSVVGRQDFWPRVRWLYSKMTPGRVHILYWAFVGMGYLEKQMPDLLVKALEEIQEAGYPWSSALTSWIVQTISRAGERNGPKSELVRALLQSEAVWKIANFKHDTLTDLPANLWWYSEAFPLEYRRQFGQAIFKQQAEEMDLMASMGVFERRGALGLVYVLASLVEDEATMEALIGGVFKKYPEMFSWLPPMDKLSDNVVEMLLSIGTPEAVLWPLARANKSLLLQRRRELVLRVVARAAGAGGEGAKIAMEFVGLLKVETGNHRSL